MDLNVVFFAERKNGALHDYLVNFLCRYTAIHSDPEIHLTYRVTPQVPLSTIFC